MNHTLMTKVLVVFILISWLSIAPLTCVSQAELHDANVGITVTILGTNRGHPQNITVSQYQAGQLHAIFETLKATMERVSSREKAIEVYRDAVHAIARTGVLDDATCATALALAVTQRLHDAAQPTLSQNDEFFNNSYCLLSGASTGDTEQLAIMYQSLPFRLAYTLNFYLYYYATQHHLADLETLGIALFNFFTFVQLLRSWDMSGDFYSFYFHDFFTQRPLIFDGCIYYGASNFYGALFPGDGWVRTYGANGNREWNGTMFGNIFRRITPPFLIGFDNGVYVISYPGVVGFSGLLFNYHNYNTYPTEYLGFARLIKLSRVPPWVPSYP